MLVETVGVGQVEVEIAGTADTTVVVVNPGWGDAVQASKAGLLEIADVFVVNKADRAGADATVRDLEGMLMLGEHRDGAADRRHGRDRRPRRRRARRRHHRASSPSRVVRELAERRELRVRDELRAIVLEWVAKQADAICSGPRFDSVAARVADGVIDPYTAATELVADQAQRKG